MSASKLVRLAAEAALVAAAGTLAYRAYKQEQDTAVKLRVPKTPGNVHILEVWDDRGGDAIAGGEWRPLKASETEALFEIAQNWRQMVAELPISDTNQCPKLIDIASTQQLFSPPAPKQLP